MAVDYSYPAWMVPRESPWQALVAGAQVGAQIANSRARNQALYAQIQQQQQQQDLQEREFVAKNSANTLANEVVRLKITNDAQDFEQLRAWWPKFSEATGDSLKNLELPSLRNPDQMQKIIGMVSEKRKVEGVTDFAEVAGRVDLATPEGQAEYWQAVGRNPSIAGKMGLQNLMAPIKTAEDLRRLETDAANRAAEQTAKRKSMEAFNAEKLAIWQQRADTGQMDAESRAEFRDFQRENIGLTHEETARRLAVMESNAATRQQRLNEKIENLSPEKRDLLKRDLDRLDEKAQAGDFAVKKPGGGMFSSKDKFGPKYFEERKKLEEQYGVSSQSKPLPLNTNLKNPITKEEYDKLAPGSEYIAPDGSTRIKK